MINIFLLGLTSLLADFSSEIIVPLLPFFIKSLGGAGLAIGLVSGVGDAVAALLKVFSGRLADRLKKYKVLVMAGYGFSAIAKFLFPLAGTWLQLLVIRSVERMGKGFRNAPRDAIVSESVKHSQRGRGFGLQRALDSSGAILGSLTVLILIWKFNWEFRPLFLLAAFIGLLSLLPLIFIKEPAILKNRPSSPSAPALFFKFQISSALKRFIAVSTVFSLGQFSFMFFILRASALLGELGFKEGLAVTLLLYVFFNIFDAAFSQLAGRLSDRWGRKNVISAAYVLFLITSTGFLLANSFAVLLLLFPIFGLFRAFIDASQRAFVSDLSTVANRASALGAFETFTGLALIPAGLIAGWLWNINFQWMFIYGLAVTGIALVLLVTIIPKEKTAVGQR